MFPSVSACPIRVPLRHAYPSTRAANRGGVAYERRALVPNAADDPVLDYDPGKTYVNSEDKVVVFNRKLPGLIKLKKAQGINVECVDFHSRLTRDDLADGIHPNKNGYDKMAQIWFEAIISGLEINSR